MYWQTVWLFNVRSPIVYVAPSWLRCAIERNGAPWRSWPAATAFSGPLMSRLDRWRLQRGCATSCGSLRKTLERKRTVTHVGVSLANYTRSQSGLAFIIIIIIITFHLLQAFKCRLSLFQANLLNSTEAVLAIRPGRPWPGLGLGRGLPKLVPGLSKRRGSSPWSPRTPLLLSYPKFAWPLTGLPKWKFLEPPLQLNLLPSVGREMSTGQWCSMVGSKGKMSHSFRG